jgi:transcriptional regulator with XRE-family HTH domain
MTDLFQHVGTRIRELRLAYDSGRGLSQEKLAEALGVTTNTISRWETATYHPGLGDLDKLASFFGVSMLEFLPSSEQPDDHRLHALIQTARQLEPEDVEEVRRYAEFRKATRMYGSANRPRPGRKPKNRGE